MGQDNDFSDFSNPNHFDEEEDYASSESELEELPPWEEEEDGESSTADVKDDGNMHAWEQYRIPTLMIHEKSYIYIYSIAS